MHVITGLSAAAIAVAVLGQFGPSLMGSVAAPVASPSPLDTATWTPYVSDRYGFSIGHPADWTERPANRTWTMDDASNWLTSAVEGFLAPSEAVLATAWSVPVEPGTTVESWLDTYCPLNTTPCVGLQGVTSPVTMDGHPGSLVRFETDIQAFIPIDDRMYVVAVWEADSDPRTAPYGGAVNLLEGFLSSMKLLPGGPALDTSSWMPYLSEQYGFSIAHPADWTERSAVGTWDLAKDADFLSPASEGFLAPGASVLATAWSVPVEPGTTVESWLAAYCPANTSPCTGLGERTTPVTMDGHPGSLVQFQDDIQVFTLVDDRMYVVGVWEPDTDPRTAPYGGGLNLLEGYLSTMKLLPGGPKVDASPSPGLSWVTDVVDRYGFEVSYPSTWTRTSAERDWTFEADAVDRSSAGMEEFTAPDGKVSVSAWSVPLGTEATTGEVSASVAWVQDFCQKTGLAPCTGIGERAVPLCLERRDCHPGLLVAFDDSVLAFFNAGIYPADKMIVVAAWSGEDQPDVAPYGGFRHLLEAFLSTMGVWPEAVPLEGRQLLDVPSGSRS